VVSVGQGSKRKTVWRSLPQCKGKREAELACAKIVQEIADGGFAVPDNATLAQWVDHWVSIGCPGRRRQAVGAHANERYANYLKVHVLPVLGHRPLQKLQATEIDALYTALAETTENKRALAPATLHGVHVTLSSCLSTAVRTRKLAKSPIADLAKIPARGESDHGVALDEAQLRKLIGGFRDHPLHTIVNVAAFTGARRSEILALRWEDLNPIARTLRIERSVEHTRRHGLRVKGPKSERGKRTIEIDAGLVTLLLAERDRHLRLVAGVPDGINVDLSLIKLPTGALMFPAPPDPGEQVSLTKLRTPQSVTQSFWKRATRIGFRDLRFHDLRGTHETMLLDMGIPVHVVAARGGHDPTVLLRSYAKRTKKGDAAAVLAIAAIARNVTGT
jgi:integrase